VFVERLEFTMPRVHSRVSRAGRVLSKIVPAVAETFRLQRPHSHLVSDKRHHRRGCRNQGRRTRLASRASPGSPGTSRPGQPGTQLRVGPRVVPPATGLTVRRSTHQEHLRGNPWKPPFHFTRSPARNESGGNLVRHHHEAGHPPQYLHDRRQTAARPPPASIESRVRAITGH
jgi:hypothetical protein